MDTGFWENSLIFAEEFVDPLRSLLGQSRSLSCFNVAVVVENGDFITSGFLLVLEDKLFDILASTKEFFAILHFEGELCPVFPALPVRTLDGSNSVRMYFHFMFDWFFAELPVAFMGRKRWH